MAARANEVVAGKPGDEAGLSADALKLATALELFQAGLLVHDDIMDKDELRRGMPTMHKIFESMVAGDAALGEAIGICAGDIYYFIAWKLINTLQSSIGKLFSRELVDVCLAQIKDVRFGTGSVFPSLEETLEVYAYKTAHYTICLPLCAGALLAGRNDALPPLEELGLNLGILFQIQDDVLGLFGNEEELGKPIGSDIREGKKTPFMILLTETLTEAEKPRFNSIFGRKTIDADDVDYIRGLVRRHGIDVKVRELAETYARKAELCLAGLPEKISGLNHDKLALLREFVDYSLSRKC